MTTASSLNFICFPTETDLAERLSSCHDQLSAQFQQSTIRQSGLRGNASCLGAIGGRYAQMCMPILQDTRSALEGGPKPLRFCLKSIKVIWSEVGPHLRRHINLDQSLVVFLPTLKRCVLPSKSHGRRYLAPERTLKAP